MTEGRRTASDVAFTPGVKAIQFRKGSRGAHARMESQGGWSTTITDEQAGFIAAQTSVFLATASVQGQPYIQHRGRPPGFLQVLDEHTIGFADFNGNRQYISSGNLAENPKAHLFLIDYTRRQRIKLWGCARVAEDDKHSGGCATLIHPTNFLDSQVLPVTADTADSYALIYAALRRKGQPIPTNDLWIAASAMEHNAMLLTKDAHFLQIDGLRSGQSMADFLP